MVLCGIANGDDGRKREKSVATLRVPSLGTLVADVGYGV